MRLVHFSRREVTKISSSRQVQRPKGSERHIKHRKGSRVYFRAYTGMKPNGFWVSDEADYGWAKWCKEGDFRPENLMIEHEVKLAPGANVLFLRTPSEMDAFTEEYSVKSGGVNEVLRGVAFDRAPTIMDIDWLRVSKDYQGIIITPYIWERRLTGQSMWYYGWDCASGCIWDAAAVESITVVKQTEMAADRDD